MTEDARDRAEKLAGRWGPTDEEAAVSKREDEGQIDEQDERDERGGSGEEGGSDEKASKTGEEDADGSNRSPESEADDEPEEANAETADEELTTREMQSQMLYLRPDFHRKLDITFEELNLRFRRERDQKLQKNRDFYAGLLRLGLERLEDVDDRDLEEVEELLGLR